MDKEREFLDEVFASTVSSVEFRLDQCESPIERLLLLALCCDTDGEIVVPWPADIEPHPEALEHLGTEGIPVSRIPFALLIGDGSREDFVWLYQALGVPIPKRHSEFLHVVASMGPYEQRAFIVAQFTVPGTRYRADLLLVDSSGNRLIVEADGHDFHERTKEQAAHDRSRDRDLSLRGWPVMRFTGSEIWKNPRRCAEQCKAHFDVLYQRQRGKPRQTT